jgi:hypothetical protein
MCQEINSNERRLRDLVCELKTFTEKQLISKLEQSSKKPLLLKPFWSVKRYLEEFRDVGVLTYENGRYSTEKRFENKRRRLIHCS